MCVTLLLIIAFLSFNCNLIKDQACVFWGSFLGDQPSSAACPAETLDESMLVAGCFRYDACAVMP